MAIDPEAEIGRVPRRVPVRGREIFVFGLVLAALLMGFFHESLLGGKILSPADVLLVEASFQGLDDVDYEPANRLLMDPVLQFQPWLELNRSEIRRGRLPLWNPFAGCGTPHLANGQSAVFDPFHIIAYLWTVADALAWMAAARLWVAGLGMFLLARLWGLNAWGRWFAGLVFPFSGFLIGWLLYPVTPVAIWTPWLFLASERALRLPDGSSVALVALVAALILFGGHVQTGAHVLLGAGLFVLWRLRASRDGRGLVAWSSGIVLGIALAAVQILPLADYLTKSPVWGDRQRELTPWWKPSKPRVLDILCTPLPYFYGSQRRGHPNLARAVGVHNLNESSGGFVGLPTLIVLIPISWKAMRRKRVKVPGEPSGGLDLAPFLIGLATIGFLGAFRLPPVDNLLRLLPVLNVTDNRRLGLWMSFAFSLLGGIGLDGVRNGASLGRRWAWGMSLGAVGLLIASAAIIASEPALRRRAETHYREAADRNSNAERNLYLRRADRQVKATVEFLPRYYVETAIGLLILAGLMTALRRRPGPNRWIPATIFVLTLADLGRFGLGLNPAVGRDIQDFEPALVAYLRRELKPGERALGIGEELPPNVLMRFGLADPRNYDSVELSRNLEWLAPLFDDQGSRDESITSRRSINWGGVARARDRLEEAGVGAIIGAAPPPDGLFEKVDSVGKIWVVRINARPWAGWKSGQSAADFERDPGRIRIRIEADRAGSLVVRESWDDGWKAWVDGVASPLHVHHKNFLEINVPEGSHEVILEFESRAVLLGMAATATSAILIIAILALTRILRY